VGRCVQGAAGGSGELGPFDVWQTSALSWTPFYLAKLLEIDVELADTRSSVWQIYESRQAFVWPQKLNLIGRDLLCGMNVDFVGGHKQYTGYTFFDWRWRRELTTLTGARSVVWGTSL